MTIFINERDIATLIDDGHASMGDFVAAVEDAYTDQGKGDFDILPRQNFEVLVPGKNRKGSLKIGGGSLRGVGVMGASLYSGGYGGMNLWITLYATDTGKVLAILHGSYIGQMKTGATAAMAAKHLSRPDAKTVGILGSADQARTQLMGLDAVRDITKARVFSPTAAHREAYAAWAKETLPHIDTEAVESAEAAVRDSDILVTVTNAHEPILEAEWIAPGTHCSIIGAHYPKRREIDTATLLRGYVIVDDLDQAFHEKGEILIPLEAGEIERDHVKGAIGEVIVGKVDGRTSDDQITMFLSGGTALEYMGVSAMLHKKAMAAGIGQVLEYEERR
ncbi:MAG: ornithine cyclodeaminase family protein [Alphaproteobacteria bacterium]|nr:ornithine cyclodeaminase family protein [Alphaproteobacteria bacterium]